MTATPHPRAAARIGRRTGRYWPRQRGAALLSVLLLVAVLASVLVLVLDDMRFALRRTHNQQSLDQLRWTLLGAEALGLERLERLAASGPEALVRSATWLDRPITLPVTGGVISAQLSDAGNCFNLNTLVDSEDGQTLSASARGLTDLALLLESMAVPVDAAASIAASLADWIDSDDRPLPGGGEDEAYAGTRPRLRTAGTLIATVGEIRAVPGISPGLLDRLGPLLCVAPTLRPAPLNVNSLSVEQAPLLRAALGRGLGIAQAQALIRNRPPRGWESVDAFWRQALPAGEEPSAAQRTRIAVQSASFWLRTRVRLGDLEEVHEARIVLDAGGRARVVQRVFGPTGSAWPVMAAGGRA